jgi:hypothetical protein
MLLLKELISLFLSFNHSFNGFKKETLVIYQIFWTKNKKKIIKNRSKKAFWAMSFLREIFKEKYNWNNIVI